MTTNSEFWKPDIFLSFNTNVCSSTSSLPEEQYFLVFTQFAMLFSINEKNTIFWYSKEHSTAHKIYKPERFVQK